MPTAPCASGRPGGPSDFHGDSAAALWWLFRRWPLASTRQAWEVGTLWLVMTLAFEFGFGHWVAGQSWNALLQAYRLHEGQLWLFILLGVWIGPPIFFRFLPAAR